MTRAVLVALVFTGCARPTPPAAVPLTQAETAFTSLGPMTIDEAAELTWLQLGDAGQIRITVPLSDYSVMYEVGQLTPLDRLTVLGRSYSRCGEGWREATARAFDGAPPMTWVNGTECGP